MTEVLLIRHAQSAPSKRLAESDWPLSAAGQAQARALVLQVADRTIDACYASPYLRTRATVEPLASALGLEIELAADLRERKLSESPLPDWREHLERSWVAFDYAPAGGESSSQCQQRVRRCVDAIVARNSGRSVVICSHGNAIALMLNSIDPTFGFNEWAAMGNPARYALTHNAGAWFWPEGGST